MRGGVSSTSSRTRPVQCKGTMNGGEAIAKLTLQGRIKPSAVAAYTIEELERHHERFQ